MLLMKVSVLYMIYLDNAATTKPNQAVLDSFLKVSEKLIIMLIVLIKWVYNQKNIITG